MGSIFLMYIHLYCPIIPLTISHPTKLELPLIVDPKIINLFQLVENRMEIFITAAYAIIDMYAKYSPNHRFSMFLGCDGAEQTAIKGTD